MSGNWVSWAWCSPGLSPPLGAGREALGCRTVADRIGVAVPHECGDPAPVEMSIANGEVLYHHGEKRF